MSLCRVITGIIFVLSFSLTSCSVEDWRSSRQPKSREIRFVLMQGQRQLHNGQFIPVVLRMDSISGETWFLSAGDTPKWESVQDNLMPIYQKDPKTSKWGLGMKLPDGRDINELSKEELIRVIQSMAQSQQIVNPNDPLGIRDKSTQEKRN